MLRTQFSGYALRNRRDPEFLRPTTSVAVTQATMALLVVGGAASTRVYVDRSGRGNAMSLGLGGGNQKTHRRRDRFWHCLLRHISFQSADIRKSSEKPITR
jgi:hypothetical protein